MNTTYASVSVTALGRQPLSEASAASNVSIRMKAERGPEKGMPEKGMPDKGMPEKGVSVPRARRSSVGADARSA